MGWKILIDLQNELQVSFSFDWVKNTWRRFENKVWSNKRKHLKYRDSMKPQIEDCFILFITYPGRGTRSFIEHSSMMYYSIFDFSDNLLSFAKKIVKKGLEENADSEALFRFYYSFCNKKVNLAKNIKEIIGAFKGYLYLSVTPVGEREMSF